MMKKEYLGKKQAEAENKQWLPYVQGIDLGAKFNFLS